jgi:hypothetical protein
MRPARPSRGPVVHLELTPELLAAVEARSTNCSSPERLAQLLVYCDRLLASHGKPRAPMPEVD